MKILQEGADLFWLSCICRLFEEDGNVQEMAGMMSKGC